MKVVKINGKQEQKSLYRVYGNNKLPFTTINIYLIFLENRGRSPNTVRAQAYDLVKYFEYLDKVGKQWMAVKLDDWVGFVQFLKYTTRTPDISILPSEKAQARTASTINRSLSSINSYYKYQYAKHDVEMPDIEEMLSNPFTSSYKSFLSFASASRPKAVSRAVRTVGRQRQVNPIPKDVSADVQRRIIKACCNRRDRLLVLLLIETGMRIGQALGLKHEDIESWNSRIIIEYRLDNPNGVYSKSLDTYHVHISDEWLDLYTNFLLSDLSEVDSDYIFVNLYNRRGTPKEEPMTYPSAKALFGRLSKRVGVKVMPHMLRHTHATDLLRAGISMEITAKRLGHKSIETTKSIYEHLTAEDLKNELKNNISRSEFLRSIYQMEEDVRTDG